MKPAIAVLGSLNMDFVVAVEHLPAPGETVLGHSFTTIPGGKGANQAAAAGRLARNSTVRMAGRVGYDVFGDQLKASLAAAGVDVRFVTGTQNTPTGVALIWVDRNGQNSIVVASGANFAYTTADAEGARAVFRGARFAMFQLETPLDAVSAALMIAKAEGARTILDPAPARPLPAELLSAVDILTPNESEALMLLGRSPSRVTPREAPELARAVLSLGPASVVLKLGDQGCYYASAVTEMFSPAFEVEAADTTAAGDTWNGAFAVALTEGAEMQAALGFANAAAGISVTRVGAQSSIPSREEVERLLA